MSAFVYRAAPSAAEPAPRERMCASSHGLTRRRCEISQVKGTLQSEFQRNVKLRITQAITLLAHGGGVSSSNYCSHDIHRGPGKLFVAILNYGWKGECDSELVNQSNKMDKLVCESLFVKCVRAEKKSACVKMSNLKCDNYKATGRFYLFNAKICSFGENLSS